MLLESDVPIPEGMSTVRSADIRRGGGTVTGGRFLIAGEFDDADRLLGATIARFESSGWRLGEVEHGLDHAAATFTKGARTARVELDRRTLDPGMSSGMIEITSGGPTRSSSSSASEPGT